MTNLKKILLLTIITITVTSCDFIRNVSTYKDTTEGFIESLLSKDYDSSLTYIALEHKDFSETNLDTFKISLARFRDIVVQNFGTELDYKFVSASKNFSTIEGKSTAPNTTKALVQYRNEKEFGVFSLLFDDTSNKILKIDIQDVKEPIPNMVPFWLFGILAISVPVFNIWVIRKVNRSDLKRKWLKYLAILVFNVPSISYSAIGGLAIKFFYFQFLFGLGFNYMGYINSVWTFGIPLGGIYWFWKLNKNNKEKLRYRRSNRIRINKIYQMNNLQTKIVLLLFIVSTCTMAQSPIDSIVQAGINYHDQGNFEKAIETYQKALEIDPKSALVNYEMALSYFSKEDYPLAIKHSDVVIDQNSAHVIPAYMTKGSALDIMGKTKESIKLFRKAIKKTKGHYLLSYNLALNYYKLGDFEDAKENLLRAIEEIAAI